MGSILCVVSFIYILLSLVTNFFVHLSVLLYFFYSFDIIRYVSLVGRLLAMRLVYFRPNMTRRVSFELMNRQLVWHGFAVCSACFVFCFVFYFVLFCFVLFCCILFYFNLLAL